MIFLLVSSCYHKLQGRKVCPESFFELFWSFLLVAGGLCRLGTAGAGPVARWRGGRGSMWTCWSETSGYHQTCHSNFPFQHSAWLSLYKVSVNKNSTKSGFIFLKSGKKCLKLFVVEKLAAPPACCCPLRWTPCRLQTPAPPLAGTHWGKTSNSVISSIFLYIFVVSLMVVVQLNAQDI